MHVHINVENLNVYTIPECMLEIEEEDRVSLPDRIKDAIKEYGVVYCDRETADRFFHAEWKDFVEALGVLKDEGYKIRMFIEDGKVC